MGGVFRIAVIESNLESNNNMQVKPLLQPTIFSTLIGGQIIPCYFYVFVIVASIIKLMSSICWNDMQEFRFTIMIYSLCSN